MIKKMMQEMHVVFSKKKLKFSLTHVDLQECSESRRQGLEIEVMPNGCDHREPSGVASRCS